MTTFLDLFKVIRPRFLDMKSRLESFARADSRLEGWFKAELIALFSELLSARRLDGFAREVVVSTPVGRRQIDFSLLLNGQYHVIEVKALCISQAAATPRNLRFYFRDNSVGILQDFRKLDSLTHVARWCLGFIYPNPKPECFRRAMEILPRDLKHWHCVTDPREFPDHVFIGVWKPSV